MNMIELKKVIDIYTLIMHGATLQFTLEQCFLNQWVVKPFQVCHETNYTRYHTAGRCDDGFPPKRVW